LCGSLIVLLNRRCVDLDALGFDNGTNLRGQHSIPGLLGVITYSLLVSSKISWAQSVRFCNHWNQVDSGAQSLHDLNVQWLQAVSCRSNKVEASMDTEINLVDTARLLLLQHIGLMLVI